MHIVKRNRGIHLTCQKSHLSLSSNYIIPKDALPSTYSAKESLWLRGIAGNVTPTGNIRCNASSVLLIVGCRFDSGWWHHFAFCRETELRKICLLTFLTVTFTSQVSALVLNLSHLGLRGPTQSQRYSKSRVVDM
jgi:hypothetical protein